MKVKYNGKVYRVIKRGYLGDFSLYKLASNFSGGSPFGAEVEKCKPVKEESGSDEQERNPKGD